MRYTFILIATLLFALNTQAQQIQQGDLAFLHDQTRLQFEFDFSQASIIGMSEEAYSAYEEDWLKDRPRYTGRFYNALENQLEGKYFLVGNQPAAAYEARMQVEQINRDGTIYATIVFTPKDNDHVLCTISLIGKGGTFGTHLNLIGDGMQSCGKQLGKLLRKVLR